MPVKICGITNLADANHAARCQAWAVGMIFYPQSPRVCSVEEAEAIGSALKRRCEVAGVFVNATLEWIADVADRCQLTLVQLHGDEGPSFCEEVRRRTGAKVIKAMSIKDRSSAVALNAYHVDYQLYDGYSRGLFGGTGKTFDWTLQRDQEPRAPVVLSGGLNVDNVGEGIRMLEPFAVDASSSLEESVGKKDPAKVKAFIEAAKEAFKVDDND